MYETEERYVNIYLQEFDNVASSKDFVGNGEFEGLSGRKIWSQNTFVGAPAAEDLAGSARAENDLRRRRRRQT